MCSGRWGVGGRPDSSKTLFHDLRLSLFPPQRARCEDAQENCEALTWKGPRALNYFVEEALPHCRLAFCEVSEKSTLTIKTWRSGGYFLGPLAMTVNTGLFPSSYFMLVIYYIFLHFLFFFLQHFLVFTLPSVTCKGYILFLILLEASLNIFKNTPKLAFLFNYQI